MDGGQSEFSTMQCFRGIETRTYVLVSAFDYTKVSKWRISMLAFFRKRDIRVSENILQFSLNYAMDESFFLFGDALVIDNIIIVICNSREK